MENIDYSVAVSKLDRFGKQNENISVNTFGFEENEIVPLKIKQGRINHVNLVLLSNNTTPHYCLIKDLNRFLYRRNKRKCKSYFCCYCLNSFRTQLRLNDLFAQSMHLH